MFKQLLDGQAWQKRLSRLPRWAWAVIFMLSLGIGIFLMDPTSQPSQTALPNLGNSTPDPLLNSTGLMLGVFFKLGLVVALIIVAAVLVRRWRGGGFYSAVRQLTLRETLHLSPRRAIHLVQVGDQVFLIGATDQAVTLISAVHPAAQPEFSSMPVKPTFLETLSTASLTETENG